MNGQDDERPPKQIGRYILREVLGSGGFGDVYAGYDSQLDRAVAIKLPRLNQSAEAIDDFLREAKRLAQLQHPGILAVYDVGQQDDYCYIITELVKGKTLSSILKTSSFTWQESCDFVADVAAALAHAHSKSMIHRDIKPQNIMVRTDGRPVILDFGLALTDIESTPTGFLQGTPAYMAPEQARGEAHRVDGRTDIYSLGVVLYQMLTGRPPFRSKTVHEVIRRVLEEEPQPLRQLVPQLPPAVADVCARAMSKKMANRYVTALDFANELHATTATTATPPSVTADFTPSSHAPTSSLPALAQVDAVEGETEDGMELHDTSQSHSTMRPSRSAVKRRVTVAVICFEASVGGFPLDAEQDYDVTQQVRHFVSESVSALGGVVISGGHEIIACFGYPTAYEDAAHRSIRATREALGRVASWATTESPIEDLAVESWALIHTDDAVVEDRGGESTDGISLSGDAAHLATKLAPMIEGHVVAVTDTTRNLIGNAFEYEGPETHRARGVSGPVNTYRITNELAFTNRVELVDPANLTPLIGRSTELSILKDRWEQAVEGMGQVVLLIGEAGLGKSRLIREVREHVLVEFQDESPLIIELRCSAYHQNTGFFPLVEYFNRLFDFQADTSAAVRWDRLLKHLDDIGIDAPQDVALMAQLIGVVMPSDREPLNLPPQRIRECTQELLLKWLRVQAAQRPLLFVVEDLHWADPTGTDVLRRHVEEFEGDSILTILTFRPEFQTPWRSLAHQTQIALNRLTKRQIGEMLQQLEGQSILPGVVQQIIDRTEGIPLFVEEFAKMISLAPMVDPEGSVSESQVLSVIPVSLQDLLTARLDRIGSNLDVVQLASTIGREFGFELLLAASELEDADLRTEVAKLTEAEILFQRGELPGAQLIFKHALIQDSAYQSMLSKQRAAVHLRIAHVLEASFPEVAGTQPELLAHHFTAGGDPAAAVEYWRKAAVQSQLACTYDEAIQNLQHGLEVLHSLPESPDRDALELQFQIPLAMTIMTSQGYAHPDLTAVHARARELCEQLGGDAPLFHVIWGIWAVQLILDNLDNAKDLAFELLSIAQEREDDGLQMEAWFAVAITTFYRAEFLACEAACKRCSELEDRPTCVAHSQYTGQDAGMAYRAYWSLVDWYLGRPDTAMRRMEDAIAFTRTLEHPFSLAYVLHHAGWLYTHCRLGDNVLQTGAECQAVARDQGFAFWTALSNVDLGTGRMVNGDAKEGLPYVEKGLHDYLRTGSLKSLSEYHGFLAEIYLEMQASQKAMKELTTALEAANRTGNHCFLAELLRLKGEVLSQMGSAHEAESLFLESLEVARAQQALSWQLRTATSLARLWSGQKKLAEARTLLTSVFEQFNEGFSTPDLKDAQTLLSRLSTMLDAND